jgi:hypothetical protein
LAPVNDSCRAARRNARRQHALNAGVQLLVALTSIFSLCGKILVLLISVCDRQFERALHSFAGAFRSHDWTWTNLHSIA